MASIVSVALSLFQCCHRNGGRYPSPLPTLRAGSSNFQVTISKRYSILKIQTVQTRLEFKIPSCRQVFGAWILVIWNFQCEAPGCSDFPHRHEVPARPSATTAVIVYQLLSVCQLFVSVAERALKIWDNIRCQ